MVTAHDLSAPPLSIISLMQPLPVPPQPPPVPPTRRKTHIATSARSSPTILSSQLPRLEPALPHEPRISPRSPYKIANTVRVHRRPPKPAVADALSRYRCRSPPR
ncbi:hypothetical protein PTTG_03505 [Puccinia triticina 1-1 BBBD Race 1]|uniref:Uncharacterized protein n=1 Tax=Puccinia triticina (isolate 1-1 / race 1 (BBBD)) TaxID=630390 RepID=A0A0C4ERT5_PUCT1|nr:hypothetical protein PTTG_03505 [Puccinia triticina 1-1 BBBD Race 1]